MKRYKGKKKNEWDAQINSYTFRKKWPEFLPIVYPGKEIENNSAGEKGEDLYDLLDPYSIVNGKKVYSTKLPYQNVTVLFSNYKLDLLRQIDQRFRLINIDNFKLATSKLGLFEDYRNMDLLMDKLVNDDSESIIASIEASNTALLEEDEFDKGVREKQKRMRLGNKIIATINYMNDQNNITSAQLNAIFLDPDISRIMLSLQTGSLLSAKTLISSKNISLLSPMDETYRIRVITMIDNYLGL